MSCCETKCCCQNAPPLSHRVRWVIFFGAVILGLLLIIPWFIICLLTNNRSNFTRINRPYFGILFPLLGIKLKVEGREHLQGRSFMMLANHQSFLDIPALLQGVSHSAFLAKDSLFKVIWFGQLLHYTGSIPVSRKNPRANEQIPFILRDRLQKGYTFTVFPEGTRSETGDLLPFKNGIFRMIKSAPVPVLPVTLIGSGLILPKRGCALHPGELRIVIHPPISPAEIEAMSMEQLRTQVYNTIAAPLAK